MKSFSATHASRQTKQAAPELDWSADSPHVYLPETFEKNYAYPVLIMLESSRSTAVEFHESLREISEQNYVGIRIVCNPSSGGGELENDLILQQIHRAICDVSGYANLHTERLYLVGSGAHATLAMRLVLAEPLKFAGFLVTDPELKNLVLSVQNFRHLKHLRGLILTSEARPAANVRREVEMLHSAGFEIRQQSFADAVKASSLMNNFVMQGILSGYCSTGSR